MLLDYRKEVIQSQHETVRKVVTTNVYGRKSQANIFFWLPLTPK